MPTEVLAKMARSRWAVIELLLMWLEVEARHGPRSCHHHPRQQKPWRAQLLLDFPPAAEKLDEWRATIRSLVAVANKDDPRPAGPSGRRSVEPPHASGGRIRGVAATVHSPPPRQLSPVSIRCDDGCDNISIASSDLRTHRDQRQVLRERAHEDARTTIERRCDTRHRRPPSSWPGQ